METSNGDFMIQNGKLLPFAEARIHCLSPAVTSAVNVFEGLRAYWNDEDRQLYVFRLDAHLRRLTYSAKVMQFGAHPYSPEILEAHVLEVLRANEARANVHLRAHLYVEEDGFMTAAEPVGMFISCVFRPTTPQAQYGCSAQVSSWMQNSDIVAPPRVKATANYFNSRLAARQARHDGYHTAVLLNSDGSVAEGPGACLFIVRDGIPATPDVSQNILESITRDTLIQGFRDWMGLGVQERRIGRSELFAAEEVFFCGTGQEVLPVTSIDGHPVGDGEVGPVTRALQQRYFDIVTGRDTQRPEWRTPVYP